MSKFLGVIPGRKIELGASILDVHNQLKSDFLGVGYRVVSENTAVTPMRLFVAPPASEPIGDDQSREILLMETGANFVQFRAVSEALQAYPQSVVFTPKTGGAASNAVTLAGVTVQQDPTTLAAGNTAAQNMRYLYEALAASTDPVIQDWDWSYTYPAAQNANDTNPHIYGIRKTCAANQTITPNANVTAVILGNYAPAGIQDANVSVYPVAFSATTDLVNGFIYFLQLNSRGIAFATRTNVGYYGPIHACWGDHAKAIAITPDGGKFSKFISPIELVVGSDTDAASMSATGRTSKVWAKAIAFAAQIPAGEASSGHPFSRFVPSEVGFIDCNNGGNSSYNDRSVTIQSSAIWTSANDQIADDFQIHRMTMSGHYVRQSATIYNNGSAIAATTVVGALQLNDWYKFVGTATDENLQFVADTVTSTTLAQVMDGTSDYPTIALGSTASLAAAGMVMIEMEAIEYTGITGNTITGCTRAKYATQRVTHFIGTPVNQGLWFIKINGGAIFAGTSKPSVP